MTPEIEVMIEKRRNFIETLKEIEEIAGACGELPAQSVLCSLIASMMVGRDLDLCRHVGNFTEGMLRQIETEKATG